MSHEQWPIHIQDIAEWEDQLTSFGADWFGELFNNLHYKWLNDTLWHDKIEEAIANIIQLLADFNTSLDENIRIESDKDIAETLPGAIQVDESDVDQQIQALSMSLNNAIWAFMKSSSTDTAKLHTELSGLLNIDTFTQSLPQVWSFASFFRSEWTLGTEEVWDDKPEEKKPVMIWDVARNNVIAYNNKTQKDLDALKL